MYSYRGKTPDIDEEANKVESVCKGCEERYTACWGSCKKYIEAKAAHDEQKRSREKDRIMNDAIDSVHYTGLKYERNNRRQKT